jgi:tetratricopeptide (TPR) repeat protein
MRYCIHVVWLLPLLGAAALGADDLPQPRKDPGTGAAPAAPGRLPDLSGSRPVGNSQADQDAAELQRLLAQLRAQRESGRQERPAPPREVEPGPAVPPPEPTTPEDPELARLRKRLQELKARNGGGSSGGVGVRPAPVADSPRVGDTSGAGSGRGAIDQTAVAQNYFKAGDYQAALDAYNKVPIEGAPGEQRAATLYMIATCHRKLGHLPQAEKFYREAAAVKEDRFIADCATWQLQTISWRREVEGQLAELRERRKGLESKP